MPSRVGRRAVRSIAVAALVLAVASPTSRADTFLLKSGSRVNGDLVEEYRGPGKARWLRIGTAFGTVSFPKGAVKKRIKARRRGGVLKVEGIVVTTLRGDVEKLRAGAEAWTRLSPRPKKGSTVDAQRSNAPNALVAPGEEIRTGEDGEIDLDIGWGVVHVEPASRVVFAAAGESSLRVLRGAAGARLDRLPKRTEFRVETPQASMGVRGTTFGVRVGAAVRLAVEEGEVTIGELSVGAGEAAEQRAGAGPVSVEPNDEDRELFDRLRRTYAVPRLERLHIPAGEFEFGPRADVARRHAERSEEVVRVAVSSFELAPTEVTNAQFGVFAEFMADHADHYWCHPDEPEGHDHSSLRAPAYEGADPKLFTGDDQPVIGVDWFTAYAFAAWSGGRLPSEVEFQYAAWGGATTPFPWGDIGDVDELPKRCWQEQSSGDTSPDFENAAGAELPWPECRPGQEAEKARVRMRTRPVATSPANAFGLYDMLGNVSEFVSGVWPVRRDVLPADGSARTTPWPAARLREGHAHGGHLMTPAHMMGVNQVETLPRDKPGGNCGLRMAW